MAQGGDDFYLSGYPEDYCREGYDYSPGISLGIHEVPAPYRAAILFTFDTEGIYGGGGSFYGEKMVTPMILDLFRSLNIHGSFNVVGLVAKEFPEMVKAIVEQGSVLSGHGYHHGMHGSYDEKHNREEIEKTIAVLQEISGFRIQGWRNPYGDTNDFTYNILEENGFKWSSDWGGHYFGWKPFYPIVNGRKYSFLEIPLDTVHYDYLLLKENGLSPTQAASIWVKDLKQAREQGQIHTYLSHQVNLVACNGIELIERTAREAVAYGDVWIPTCTELADWWGKRSKLSVGIVSASNTNGIQKITASVTNKGSEKVSGAVLKAQVADAKEKFECSISAKTESFFKSDYLMASLPELAPGKSMTVEMEFIA